MQTDLKAINNWEVRRHGQDGNNFCFSGWSTGCRAVGAVLLRQSLRNEKSVSNR